MQSKPKLFRNVKSEQGKSIVPAQEERRKLQNSLAKPWTAEKLGEICINLSHPWSIL